LGAWSGHLGDHNDLYLAAFDRGYEAVIIRARLLGEFRGTFVVVAEPKRNGDAVVLDELFALAKLDVHVLTETGTVLTESCVKSDEEIYELHDKYSPLSMGALADLSMENVWSVLRVGLSEAAVAGAGY
jgi:hypothetical protein